MNAETTITTAFPIPAASNDSLEAWFDEIYRPRFLPSASRQTLKHWRQSLSWFRQGLSVGTLTLTHLQGDCIESAMRWMLGKGMATSTADVMSMKISALWRFLARTGIVATWPRFPRPRATPAGLEAKATLARPKRRRRRRPVSRWRCAHPDRVELMSAAPQQRPEPIIIPAVLEASTPLRSLFELYRQRKLRGAGKGTSVQYEGAIRLLSLCIGREPVIGDLTEDNVQNAIWSKIDNGRTKQTANSIQKKLLALWRFACRRGVLKEWPELTNLKEPRRIPFAWLPDQMERLFVAIARQSWLVGRMTASAFFRGLLLVMWDSAERLGALLQIRRNDIDFDSRLLIVPAEFRKFKTADAAYTLHPETIEALQILLIMAPAKDQERIFAWPWSYDTLFNRYRRILIEAGLPANRRTMFHAIRRTVGSLYKQAGGDATALLGHSDRRVTDCYMSPLIVKTPMPADLIFRPDARRVRRIVGPESDSK